MRRYLHTYPSHTIAKDGLIAFALEFKDASWSPQHMTASRLHEHHTFASLSSPFDRQKLAGSEFHKAILHESISEENRIFALCRVRLK